MLRVKLDRFSPCTAVVNYIPNFCACAKFVAPQWLDYFKVGGAAPGWSGRIAEQCLYFTISRAKQCAECSDAVERLQGVNIVRVCREEMLGRCCASFAEFIKCIARERLLSDDTFSD